MTDSEIREVVNELRAIAKNFSHTQQLREMISSYIVPILQAARATPADHISQARDDTGRLTSDYEPTKREIQVAREAICREFGNNGTDGYYIRILKAIHGASPRQDYRDAERYRWLRDPGVDVALVIDKVTGEMPTTEGLIGGGYKTYEYRSGKELDSAIDAAIRALTTPSDER